MSRRKSHPSTPLRIRELAVDPADVDRETYPVTIRLTRALTEHEARALATGNPGVQALGDSVVLEDAKIDDVAHAHAEGVARLEAAERLAEELEGEDLIAAARREEQLRNSGSHLGDRHDPYAMS